MLQIKAIIAEVLRVSADEVNEHTSMETNSLWDSLSHMEIIYTLEKKFGIEFSGDEIIQITSVNKIKDIISKKVGDCLEA